MLNAPIFPQSMINTQKAFLGLWKRCEMIIFLRHTHLLVYYLTLSPFFNFFRYYDQVNPRYNFLYNFQLPSNHIFIESHRPIEHVYVVLVAKQLSAKV